MAKPTVKVEIAFSDLPYVSSPTWTDVTSYVRSVSTRRGRGSDWDDMGTGTASIILDNRDRRFDPTYTSGPYYGLLQPRRQIRVTADAGTGSGYVAIFRGFVAGWPVEVTNAGYDSTVTLQCFDILGLLSQAETPREWADYYIRNTLAPRHYWRLDENINPTQIPQTTAALSTYPFQDYGTAPEPLYLTSAAIPLANADALAPGLTSRSVSFPAASQRLRTATTATNIANANSYFVSMWATLPNTFATGNAFIATVVTYSTAAGNQYAGMTFTYNYTNARFEVTTQQQAAGQTSRVYYFPVGIDSTIPHHLAFQVIWASATTAIISVFLDGQNVPNTTSSTFVNPFGPLTSNYFQVDAATSQQVIFREGTTGSTAEIQTLYGLSNNVLSETTAARFTRLLDTTSIPAAWEAPTASPAGTVAPFTVGGAPLTSELELVTTSEGGELFVTKAGVLTMTNRTYYATNTKSITTQATFGGSGEIPIAPEASYTLSADDIRNSLEISWAGDTTYSVKDTASINEYGAQQTTIATQLSTIADVTNLGSYLVGYGKVPRYIFSDTILGQGLTAAQWNTVLNLELLERIRVTINLQTGNDPAQTQLIQAIEHDITPGDWRTTIRGSSRWSSVFILDSSLLDGLDLLA